MPFQGKEKIQQVCVSPATASASNCFFSTGVKWVLTKWALTCFGTMFTQQSKAQALSKYEFYNAAEPAQHNAQLIIGNNGGGHNTCWEFHA